MGRQLGHPPGTHFLGFRQSSQRAGWMPCAASTRYITWHREGVRGAGRASSLCLPREASPGHVPSCQPFSFVLPNCPDRTHCPFTPPTCSERRCPHGRSGPGKSRGAGMCPTRAVAGGVASPGHWRPCEVELTCPPAHTGPGLQVLTWTLPTDLSCTGTHGQSFLKEHSPVPQTPSYPWSDPGQVTGLCQPR